MINQAPFHIQLESLTIVLCFVEQQVVAGAHGTTIEHVFGNEM
jgi:hypothetical protein